MNRLGLPNVTTIRKFIHQFPDLQYDGVLVKCTFCDSYLLRATVQKCKIHIHSRKHIQNKTNNVPYWKFLYDFVYMMSVCNIPQNVVNNDHFRLFWKKYVPAWKLPTIRQLRYSLPDVKEKIETLIISNLRHKKIWLTVDKTTDGKKNLVVNVVVRELKPDGASVPYLLCSQRLKETIAETIVDTVYEAVQKFGIDRDQILMLVTDEAAYMLKAGSLLKTYCPNLLHITCLLRTCHLVAEEVRNCYPAVDRLVSQTKLVFVKSPRRIREFVSSCPGIPKPPKPVITKPATWIEAVLYYNKYFNQIKPIVMKFNPQEANVIIESQQHFQDLQVEQDLDIISKNYTILLDSIRGLENSALPLADSLKIVENLRLSLEKLGDISGQRIYEKFQSVLLKNPDYHKLLGVRDGQLSESDIDKYFHYANITSFDAQCSFSKYTRVFTPLRRNLSEQTMESFLMMQFFAHSLHKPLTFDQALNT